MRQAALSLTILVFGCLGIAGLVNWGCAPTQAPDTSFACCILRVYAIGIARNAEPEEINRLESSQCGASGPDIDMVLTAHVRAEQAEGRLSPYAPIPTAFDGGTWL
jgi:hypothetical protein